ncbi:MAG: putative O-glycosylation ligase, exosortase A system-associated [Stellaceae bacterium]
MRAIAFYFFILAIIPSIFFHPYTGVLLYSWMSFMSPQQLLWIPPTIPVALIAAVLTVVSWVFSEEPKRLRFDSTVWLIVAFMAWISFTTLLALNPARATYLWSRTIKELLFVLITIALTTNRIRLHALLWVMVIAIGYFGWKGGLFTILHAGSARIYGPPDTAIYNNNDLGVGLLVALPLMNYVRTNSAHRWVRIGLLAVMMGSFLSIVGTFSRGALLGLAAVSLLLFLKSRRKLVSGVVIAATFVSAIAFMPDSYVERMQTMRTYEKDESAMSRIQVWGVALNIGLDRPLTGGGFAVTESQVVIDRYLPGFRGVAVHDIYLGVLAAHGFIGLLLWLALLLVGWRNARWIQRSSRGRPEWQWAGDFGRMSQVSLVGYCVAGAFGNYEYWDYYFTIVGLLAAARTMMERTILPQRSAPVPAATFRPAPLVPVHHPLRDPQ